MKTIIPDENNLGQVRAELSIIETVRNNTPDYEIFDVLYIYLQVNDLNTEEGDGFDSALLQIAIRNINDNPPEFTPATIASDWSVTENSDLGTFFGLMAATDLDQLQELKFFIE